MLSGTRKNRLFLLEEDKQISELLFSEYSELGFEVLVAHTIAEANKIISQHEDSIDVSIFSLQLPDGDGLEFLKELRQQKFKNPVIFIATNGNKHNVLNAFKAGAYDFLEKPFSVSGDLTPIVTRALESVVLLRENHSLTEKILHSSKLAALGELSATVLHDIRGPLSMIQCVCDDFEEELQAGNTLPASEQIKHLEQIRKACNRVKKLGEHLRNYSRQDTNESPEYREVITIVEDSVSLVQQKIRSNKIKANIKYESTIKNLQIHCYPNKLEQAIMNLCSNACDAMKDSVNRELCITIGCDSKWLSIAISDTGAGMSQEVQDKLSENFFTTKPPGEGTGLGLKIVRTIIQEHEGVLDLTSSQGKGTTFTVKIPASRILKMS